MAVSGYSAKQIWLHWVLALLIIIQFVLHDGILAISDAMAKGEEPAMTLIARSHIIIGILIFLLALIPRLCPPEARRACGTSRRTGNPAFPCRGDPSGSLRNPAGDAAFGCRILVRRD